VLAKNSMRSARALNGVGLLIDNRLGQLHVLANLTGIHFPVDYLSSASSGRRLHRPNIYIFLQPFYQCAGTTTFPPIAH
jgi:hypothetical protein